jgi:hypothetical protein
MYSHFTRASTNAGEYNDASDTQTTHSSALFCDPICHTSAREGILPCHLYRIFYPLSQLQLLKPVWKEMPAGCEYPALNVTESGFFVLGTQDWWLPDSGNEYVVNSHAVILSLLPRKLFGGCEKLRRALDLSTLS